MGEAGLVVGALVLLGELLVLLLLVAGGLALVVRRVGAPRLQAWLGGGVLAGACKGAAVGFLVPFCTYSALPAFVGMVDARARTSTWAGFLLAAPLLDPVVVAVLWLLFGFPATLAYTVVGAITVVALAVLADVLGLERHLRHRRAPEPVEARAAGHPGVPDLEVVASPSDDAACDAGPDPYRDPRPWAGLRPEVRDAGRYAAGLVRQLALPMVLAVVVATAIVGYVPQELLTRVAGPDHPFAVPVAAAVGVPFYVSTEAFLPIASALHDRGMGVGAAFALVVSAAGVNVPELALLARLLRPVLLAAYVAAVLAVAIAAGYLVPLVV